MNSINEEENRLNLYSLLGTYLKVQAVQTVGEINNIDQRGIELPASTMPPAISCLFQKYLSNFDVINAVITNGPSSVSLKLLSTLYFPFFFNGPFLAKAILDFVG